MVLNDGLKKLSDPQVCSWHVASINITKLIGSCGVADSQSSQETILGFAEGNH